MSPRKVAPLLIGALLLTALLLLYFSQSMNWNQAVHTDGIEPVEPADGMLMAPLETELHVTVSMPAAAFKHLEERTEQFMLQFPHISVKLSNEKPSGERYSSIVMQSIQGVAPDIMLLDNSWIVPLAERGYLKPIDSLMAGDVLSDQLPGLLEPLKWNGYLWGAPGSINPYVVAWNKPLLTELGHSDPPQAWTEFQALTDQIAAAAPSPDGEQYLMNLSPGDLTQLLLWLTRFDTDHQLLNLDTLTESQQDKLMWLESRTQYVSAAPISSLEQINQLVMSNRLLMLIIPWESYYKMSASARNNLLVEQESIYYPWMNGHSFVISSASKWENEAMIWIQEMTDASIGLQKMEDAGTLPVRASLYSEQVRLLTQSDDLPPNWWLQALTEIPQEQSYKPDPNWPLKWKNWQSAWAASGENPERFISFVQAVQQ